MKQFYSPLRYPGGKGKMADIICDLININNFEGVCFHELYCGGAAVSLSLLFNGVVSSICLNDFDQFVSAFWHSILEEPDEFIKLIDKEEVSLSNYYDQRKIYLDPTGKDILEKGFAFFYLNRCNRSGILGAGPIGGKNQNGNYDISVRFNKSDLISRIEKIQKWKSKIHFTKFDAIDILAQKSFSKNDFLFLDPPYFLKGATLYDSFYIKEDHIALSQVLANVCDTNWIMTYDYAPEILDLYRNLYTYSFNLKYTLQNKKTAPELFIMNNELRLPRRFEKKGLHKVNS